MIRWFVFSGLWIRVLVVVWGIVSFCFQVTHVLGSLLSLEVIMLGLYYLFIRISLYSLSDLYLGISILTISVCEARLGLSLLISMIRSYGTDYVTVFSMF